jgi:hypothetical protein
MGMRALREAGNRKFANIVVMVSIKLQSSKAMFTGKPRTRARAAAAGHGQALRKGLHKPPGENHAEPGQAVWWIADFRRQCNIQDTDCKSGRWSPGVGRARRSAEPVDKPG